MLKKSFATNWMVTAVGVVLLTSGALASAQALKVAAPTSQLLITKTNYPGFTSADGVRSESCNVYVNRVDILRAYGATIGRSFSTKEIVRFRASKETRRVIAGALDEELNSAPNFLCDGPSTVIKAYDRGEEFILFQTGGCGTPREERTGSLSQMLIDVVDAYCPETYDFGSSPPLEPKPAR